MENGSGKLRWAILGTSFISSVMANAIAKSDLGEVYCVAARTSESVEKFANKHKIGLTYTEYDLLLADPKVDVVYIGLPTYVHAEWVKKCALAGKHVLNEKSFAINTVETTNALDVVHKQGNIFCMEGIFLSILMLQLHFRIFMFILYSANVSMSPNSN